MELTLDALRHRYRNQIQNMTSLVGLFGRQMPDGATREAFADLRARFEAIGVFAEGAPDDGSLALRLTDFVEAVRGFLDPDGRHRLSARIETGDWTGAGASAAAQLIAELLIELYRQGFASAESCAGLLVVEPSTKRSIRISVAQTAPDVPRGPRPRPDPGRALADSLARSLGGKAVRETSGPLSTEVLIFPEGGGR